MAPFAAYGATLASLGIWALIVMVLSGLSTMGRKAEDRCACGAPKRDYADPVYRRHRAFQNALEIAPAFIAAVLAAVLAGASPFWVNLLSVVFILSRIAMAFVHIQTEIQPARSAFYAIGWLCVIVMALMAVVTAL